MFGNLFGDLEKKQKELMDKAADIVVEKQTEGIKVAVNGKKEIVNITITDLSVLNDKEQLEDLLVATLNRALDEAGTEAAIQAQQAMEQMLPPGMADMFNLK